MDDNGMFNNNGINNNENNNYENNNDDRRMPEQNANNTEQLPPFYGYDAEKFYYEAKQRLKDERKRLKAERRKAYLEKKKRDRENRIRANVGVKKLIAVGLISAIVGGIFSSLGTLAFYSIGTKLYGDNFLGIVDESPRKVIEKVSIVNEYDSSITAIADKVSKSVVGIRVTTKSTSPFFGAQEERGEGSGIIYKSDGYIITNFHVIQKVIQSNGTQKENSKIEVVIPDEPDKLHEAKIVGYDWMTDLAVIKVELKNLPVIEIDNSDNLKIGELAVAVGNPGGLDFMGSVSVGVISGLNRSISLESSVTMKLIQTDAAINPGNSGGALVNYLGKLIGVNSVKLVSEEYEGMGFAIPSNQVVKICDDLIENKYVKGRPFIGITMDPNFDESVAQQVGVPEGVLVDSVSPASPAYKAGIERGDIIIKFNGVRVKNFEELNNEKNKYKPGDKVTITIYRNGKEHTLDLVLSESNG